MQNPSQSLTQATRRLALAASLLAAGLLAGCAGNTAPGGAGAAPAAMPTTPPAASAEQTVSARAQQRVDLLVASQFDQAYNYLLPSYRALNTPESYRNTFGGGAKWIKPKVSKVKCETEERCAVTVELGVLVVAPGFGTKPVASTMFETWLKEDGQWWYYQRN